MHRRCESRWDKSRPFPKPFLRGGGLAREKHEINSKCALYVQLYSRTFYVPLIEYYSPFSRRRTDRPVLAETGRRALRANHFARVKSERRAFWPFSPLALSRPHPTRLTPFPMATSLSTHQLFTPAGFTGRRVSRGAFRRRATSVNVRPLARKNICPLVRARVVYRERCGASLASRPRVAHVPRPFPTSQVRASYGDAQDGDSEQMHVPEDAFKNEMGHNISPERKAATALGNLFTMAATRVILDQFTGTRHRSPVYYKMVRAVRGPDVAPPPPNPRAPLAPDLEPRKNPVPPNSRPPDFFLPRPRPARARVTGGLPERKPAEERQRVARQAHARAR